MPATLSALGVWRSLVARSVRVGEVPSSNLGTPIESVWSLHLPVDDGGAGILDVVEARFRGDRPRLRRAEAELQPEGLRARGDRLPCVLRSGVLAAEHVVAVERPHGDHAIPLREQVAHDAVARPVGVRRGADEGDRLRLAEDLFRGSHGFGCGLSCQAMAGWARTHGITLVGGSITERREGREKLSNTSIVFDSEGSILGLYRKIHLFDVEVGGHVYRESDAEEPGDEPVVVESEGWPIGLTVCYDLRFPELYRILALQGAELVTVPAHFTLYTGRDHWELLLRPRAVENQYYVAAAAQIGETIPGRLSYGRSLIADPWGIVVAVAPDEETVISAELDRRRLLDVRAKLPSLASRQADAYRWPTPTP